MQVHKNHPAAALHPQPLGPDHPSTQTAMDKAPDEAPQVPPSPPAEVPHVAAQENPADNIEDKWDMKVTVELDASGIRHKNAFFALLRDWFGSRDYTCILLTKRKNNEILQFCLDVINGAEVWSLFLAGNKQAYMWSSKYDGILVNKCDGIVVDTRGADDCVIDLEHAVLVL